MPDSIDLLRFTSACASSQLRTEDAEGPRHCCWSTNPTSHHNMGLLPATKPALSPRLGVPAWPLPRCAACCRQLPLLLQHQHTQRTDCAFLLACLLVHLCEEDGTRLHSAATHLSACLANLPPPLPPLRQSSGHRPAVADTHTHTGNVFRP